MRRLLSAAALGVLTLVPTGPLHAQSGSLAVEVVAGATMPVGDLSHGYKSDRGYVAGVTNDLGYSLGGNLIYAVHPRLSVLAGYRRTHFDCMTGGGCPRGTDGLVLQNVGLGIDVPIVDRDGFGFRARALTTYARPHFTGGDMGPMDWGFGYELGAALDIHVNDRFTVAPQFRWSGSRGEVPVNQVGRGTTVNARPSHAGMDLVLRAALD